MLVGEKIKERVIKPVCNVVGGECFIYNGYLLMRLQKCSDSPADAVRLSDGAQVKINPNKEVQVVCIKAEVVN